MDVTQKRGLVKAEIHKVHPLDADAAGGSGHLSHSRLGDVVVGETAKDGSFTFAAEVTRETEFGGSTHWFRGTIVPGGESRIEALPSWNPDTFPVREREPRRKGAKEPSLSPVRRTRRELGLPVLGEYDCARAAQAELKRHLRRPVKERFFVQCRTGPERIDGDVDTFDFAALLWDGQERAVAVWYVGTVQVDLKTDQAKAKIKKHAKSGELVRHPNFNAKDLEKGEEKIWTALGFPAKPEVEKPKSTFDADAFLKDLGK